MKHRFCMALALIGLAVLAGCGGGGGTQDAPGISEADHELVRTTVKSGSISQIRALFTSRPELLEVPDNRSGEVPLHLAYDNPLPDVASNVLLELGANPNSRCPVDDGRSALNYYAIHHAVLSNSNNAVIALINHGVNLNVKDGNGDTAIHRALFVGNGKAILRTLLNAGADGSIPNRQGETPYYSACNSYNGTAEILAEFGYTQ